jgi:hypothetical protein
MMAMSKITAPSPQVRELLKMFGAPAHCVEFTLMMKPEAPVTVTVTYFPDISVPETVTKRFVLVEADDDQEFAPTQRALEETKR